MAIKWEKAYKGPFNKQEALDIVNDLKIKADKDKNGIIKVAIRKVANKNLFNVYIKTDI